MIRENLRQFAVLSLTILGGAVPTSAGTTFGAPTATWGPGGTTLASITIPGVTDYTGTLLTSTSVNVQFYLPNGSPAGGPVPATVGPTGTLTMPPPPIPPGAAPFGGKLDITDPADPTLSPSKKIVWYNSAWFGTTAKVKIDPYGLPGLTSTQSWFFDEPGLELTGFSSDFGAQTSAVESSNFDLVYTALGGGLYRADIYGDNSYIRLANGTYISFYDGLFFGSLQYLFNDGVTANGTFNFNALGMSGTWKWDQERDYTEALADSVTPFSAPAISTEVPEPGTSLMIAAGLLAAGLARRRATA